MSNDNKFCPNCGEQLKATAKFCTACGFNFEENTAPTAGTQPEQPQVTKQTTSGEGIQGLLKRKEVQIGLIVAAVLALAYFFIGGLDIAGTYVSDSGETVKISRNGKVTAMQNEYDQSGEIVFYIEESPHDQFYYSVLPEKGVEMELSMPLDSMGSSDLQEFNMFASVLGFKTKETKDSFILSGKVTPETASMMDIDFSELNVELDVEDDGIYLLGDYYQKQ